MSTIAFAVEYLGTVRDRGLVPPIGNGLRESNGHVIDDVM